MEGTRELNTKPDFLATGTRAGDLIPNNRSVLAVGFSSVHTSIESQRNIGKGLVVHFAPYPSLYFGNFQIGASEGKPKEVGWVNGISK